MKKPLKLFLYFGISILLSLFYSSGQAALQKTEKIGKVVADSMPAGVNLKWDDPSGFDKVVVVRNSDHLPASSSDGNIIYQGKDKTYMDTDIQPGTAYYYGIFFIPVKKTYQQRAITILSKPVQIAQDMPQPAKTTLVTTSVGSQFLLFFGMFDSIKDFWFSLIRVMQALIIFLGVKSKKKNGWGIVYDWETKEPLKNVVLSLISERKEKIASVISDSAGRFGFLVEEGDYVLEIGRNKYYEFAPEMYEDTDIYGNVYRGKPLTIKNEVLLDLNVPLHAKVPRTELERVRGFAKLQTSKIFNFIVEFSFWVGFAFIVFSIWGAFSWLKVGLAIFYVAVFAVRLILLRASRKWGVVFSDKDKKPVPFAVVRAFKDENNDKVQTGVCVSNSKGGFYMLVPPAEYQVSIKGRTLEGVNFDKETNLTAKKGLINGVYYV